MSGLGRGDLITKSVYNVSGDRRSVSENRVFYPLKGSQSEEGREPEVLIFYFHGLAREYPSSADKLIDWSITKTPWLRWLENDNLRQGPVTKVYVASYEEYGKDYDKSGRADLYHLGELLFKGVTEVLKSRKDRGKSCHVILIGHSVGGLAIKQLILEAAESGFSGGENEYGDLEDLGLIFLQRLAGIFFFSTPHLGSIDLMRLTGRGSRSHMGAALAALGKVTDRLNRQFMERKRALGIPTAALFESNFTKMGGYNERVVSEASARMDVDIAMRIHETDHFSICQISKQLDTRFIFLQGQIRKWLASSMSLQQQTGHHDQSHSKGDERKMTQEFKSCAHDVRQREEVFGLSFAKFHGSPVSLLTKTHRRSPSL